MNTLVASLAQFPIIQGHFFLSRNCGYEIYKDVAERQVRDLRLRR